MSMANERSLALELAEVKADLMEQCHLLGMSGEQELKHLAQIESLEHERDALRAELDALRVQRPFDAEEAQFRSAFEACIKDGQWPVKRKGEGYRSPMTQMAFEIAFCVVNKLKLCAHPVPAQSVPEGWRLVPIEPTQEMLGATSWPNCAATDYKAMLAAAPEMNEINNGGHVEDATAEQDSRQKQARIERLEAAVKELRDSLFGLTEYAATSDERQYGTLAASFVRNVALEALKNTEGV